MKNLFLWVNDEGWKSFEYENLSDLKEEFEERGASIGDGARIGYGASIGDRARIGYGASIGDGARIGYGASIGDRARIGDGASIGDGARIGDGAKVKSICINGSKHIILYWGEDKIQIGCQSKTIQEWIDTYSEVGIKHEYSIEEIDEYKNWIDTISTWHKEGKFEPIKIS